MGRGGNGESELFVACGVWGLYGLEEESGHDKSEGKIKGDRVGPRRPPALLKPTPAETCRRLHVIKTRALDRTADLSEKGPGRGKGAYPRHST